MKGWQDFNSNVVNEIFDRNVEITTADCAKDAYDILLTQKPFDVIITDMQMEEDFSPKFAGEWLIEQIKSFSRYTSTKVIIISASYNARQIAEAFGVGCIPKSTALKCLSAYKEILLK